MTFDEPEYERWTRASADEAAQAEALASLDHHHGAVLHFEQGVQLCLKGLLHAVGSADPRGHHLEELALAAADQAALSIDDELRAGLRTLARDYLPTRYPDALVEGTPRQHFGAADVDRARAVWEQTRAAVWAAWEGLRSAADEPGS